MLNDAKANQHILQSVSPLGLAESKERPAWLSPRPAFFCRPRQRRVDSVRQLIRHLQVQAVAAHLFFEHPVDIDGEDATGGAQFVAVGL